MHIFDIRILPMPEPGVTKTRRNFSGRPNNRVTPVRAPLSCITIQTNEIDALERGTETNRYALPATEASLNVNHDES